MPRALLDQELVFSRLPDQPKEYVQDRMRGAPGRPRRPARARRARTSTSAACKGLEAGVEAAFAEIGAAHGLDWPALRATMREQGRYHVETY